MKPKKRMKLFLAVICLIFSFVLAHGILLPQSAEALYEAAVYEKEAGGDLEGAIEIFQKIVKEFPQSRKVAAKAQLQIGMCYEKLGIKEAQRAYEDVVANYPEQTEAVKQAKEKLSVLLRAAIPAKEEPSGFTIKKIWTGLEADGLGKISPDGRFLAYTDWVTGDLAVLEIATGKKRRLTNKGSWMKSSEFALFLAWSPDGKQIAYNWWDEPSYVDMRIIDSSGSKPPRTIHNMKNPKPGAAFIIGWTPDGKSVLVEFYEAGGTQARLSLVSIENGSERIIKEKSLAGKYLATIDISPDGRWIAYSHPVKGENDHNSDIYLVSMDGKVENSLIEHPACDLVIGWLPDGKTMLFLSDREGTDDVWAISVKDGRPNGSPVMIKEGIGQITPQGFDRDGSFYYVTAPSRGNVYTAGWDPKTGEILKKPENPIKHLGKKTNRPSYSPDGKYLAYVSVRGGNPVSKEQHVICIRSLDTGDEREFKTEYKYWDRIRWSPDCHFILGFTREGEDQNQHGLLCLLDTRSGETKPVFRFELDRQKQWGLPVFSLDGQSVYYVHTDRTKKVRRLIIRNLKTGDEKDIDRPFYEDNDRFRCALSPDGKQFALLSFVRNDNLLVIHILPVSGGEARELYRTEYSLSFSLVLTWSQDGKYILFSNVVPGQEEKAVPTFQLFRISAEGGEPQALDLKMTRIHNLSVHPDGKTFAFYSFGTTYKEPILWKMENFLPGKKDNQ
ncbi:tetratricopeptide repeat protein [Acidobacteriota bacterium]